MSTRETRYISEDLSGDIFMVDLEIAAARDGDFDDVLNVCESLLALITKLNDQLNRCE